jgi:hypothetical protein
LSKRLAQLALTLLLLTPGVTGAQPASASSDDWQFFLTPYLWGSGMSGIVGLAGREVDYDVSVKELLKSLDFGLMGNFEARRRRWSIGSDFVYTNLGKEATFATAPGTGTGTELAGSGNANLDIRMTILEADVGYEVAKSLDVLAGARGLSSSSTLNVDSGTLADVHGSFVDPIVGVRFRRNLSEKFWVSLRGDVGGFGVGSDFSWFVNAAGGYRVSRLISLDFGYRVWDFRFASNRDLKKLDATLAGIAFGVTFHF